MKKLYFLGTVLGLIIGLNAQNIPPNVPDSGLIAWFPFNGNANDESGNGHHGIRSNVTPAPDRNGVANAAYLFNGFSSRIDLLDIDFPERTVSLWFHPLSFPSGNNQAIVFSNDHHALVNGMSHIGLVGNNLFGNFGHGLPNAPNHCVTPTDNVTRWFSIVVTKDSDTTRYFFDGVLVCKRPNANLKSTANILPAITRVGTSRLFERWYHGYIDDIAIWNRALSEAEIMALIMPCSEYFVRQPTSKDINPSAPNVSFVCRSSDPNAGYSWEINTGLGWTGIMNVPPFYGVNTDSLYLSPILTAFNNTSFRCKVTTHCNTMYSDSVHLRVDEIFSLDDFSVNLSVYPNPAKDFITIIIQGSQERVQYTLFDVTGKSYLQGYLTNGIENWLDVSGLSRGVYFLNVYSESSPNRVFKIILNE